MEWLVVDVETPAHVRRAAAARERIIKNLRLAEKLGAEKNGDALRRQCV